MSMMSWVKDWGILARRGSMSMQDKVRWLRQWVPFAARTVMYSLISLILGPFTPNHGASLWAGRRWSIASARSLGLDWRISGLEHVPETGAFVYACNHQSLLDILVLGASLSGDFKWCAKRKIMNVPFMGWHLRLSGHVPVDRRSGSRAAQDTVRRFEEVLGRGKPLLVFPEGTRSADGRVKRFKTGGFRAAVRAGVPVVPVALEGTGRILRKGATDLGENAPFGRNRQHAVLIRVAEPILPRPDGEEADRITDLCERTRTTVVAMHEDLLREIDQRVSP